MKDVSNSNRFNRLGDIAPAEGKTVELTQVLVLIVKDPMAQIPKTVMDHELPILRAIFGEENVVEKETRQVTVTNFTAAGEYERLIRNYDASQSGVVQAVYGPNPRDLADVLGVEYQVQRGNRNPKLAQSMQVDNTQADTGGAFAGPISEIKPAKGETFEAHLGHSAGSVSIAGGVDKLPGASSLPGSSLRADRPTAGADPDAQIAAKTKPRAPAKAKAVKNTAKPKAASKKK